MLRHEALRASIPRRSALRVKSQAKFRRRDDREASDRCGPDLAETIRSIIVECGNPARVLELYHWSLQPGFGDAVRALALLSGEKRAAIQSFLAMARDTGRIDVVMRDSGELRFSSPEVAVTLKALRTVHRA
jgi:hypothetical protein